MKKIVVSISVALFVATHVACAAGETNSGWGISSVTASSVVADKYCAFGSGALFYDNPVLQSDMVVTLNNGAYALLWHSAPVGNSSWNENFASEMDYGLGWSGPLSKFGLKGQAGELVIDVGITYFDEPGVFSFGPGDVWYSHVKLTKSIDKVDLFALFENYTVAPGSTFEGGNLYSVGASTFRPVPKTPLSLFCSLSCTYDDGGFGFDNGFLLKGCVEADWKVTSHISLILPRISYYVPLTVRDSRETDAVISGGISLKF